MSLLTYVPNLDPEDVFDHHTAFAAWVPQAPEPAPVFANSRNANRRLRIGYVSSDFRAHPVTRNMLPLLRHHDRAQVEVCLYHNTRARDSDTERCQALADLWRETPSLRDDQLAALMRQDGIDIAIILAGHFDSNRIALPRFRPAPICMGFHDVATSGFTETDYLISDITLTPRATREMFSERVLHLPSYYLHDPLDDVPTPPQPGRINGAITFGAFNNTSKINDEVLSLWARVINAVPNSRLSLKYRNFYASTAVRERIVRVMAEHDVSSKRLEFQTGWDDRSAHLARIGGVDIALDTFPFSGSTTTFESLWMGVPVVTWPQTPMVSRWSASQLKALGLSDLIAQDAGDFVRIARELALDIPRLEAVRLNLRERLRASPLCDGALRARQIERFYRATWHRWVARG
ncbi:MAG: hypothetical protein A2516_04075 [Alphaproteobacteria bacterium RIFOXYD12_FULL_60_8]|nr:MAG: hypothetical protein A2516_04075 [Alphaproteobacteria bacterium RIFOXYD12_FULL_60_8]